MHPHHAYTAYSAQEEAILAYESNDWQGCIAHYGRRIALEYPLDDNNAQKFNTAKIKHRQARAQLSPKVAICGWELSSHTLSRAISLAQLYQSAGFEMSIIGCIHSPNPENPKPIWHPFQQAQRNLDIRCEYFQVANTDALFSTAVEFVSKNPRDIIHLSKPRLPSIVIGRLYQLLWDAKVIMDIDEDIHETLQESEHKAEQSKPLDTQTHKIKEKDLHSVDKQYPLDKGLAKVLQPFKYLTKQAQNNSKKRHQAASKFVDSMCISSTYWLKRCMDLTNQFDAITVANTVLYDRYQGMVLPTVRDAKNFVVSAEQTQAMREAYNIPSDSWVVLFCGTPEPQQGLIRTAKALAKIDRADVFFMIIGDFASAEFKEKLESIEPVNFRFLPTQPLSDIPKFIAMGDVCVLMQDQSIAQQYLLPAKIIDALAMQMTVICTETPVLQPLIEAKAIIPTTEDKLTETLMTLFNKHPHECVNHQGHHYFMSHLSTQANREPLKHLVNQIRGTGADTSVSHPLMAHKCYNLQLITKQGSYSHGRVN